LSEGTLIVAVKEGKVTELINLLAENGINSAEVGYLTESSYGFWIEEPDGSRIELVYPEADPYWNAYINAVNKGWR
jgi:hydrogenase expression/formation protein HypE